MKWRQKKYFNEINQKKSYKQKVLNYYSTMKNNWIDQNIFHLYMRKSSKKSIKK